MNNHFELARSYPSSTASMDTSLPFSTMHMPLNKFTIWHLFSNFIGSFSPIKEYFTTLAMYACVLFSLLGAHLAMIFAIVFSLCL